VPEMMKGPWKLDIVGEDGTAEEMGVWVGVTITLGSRPVEPTITDDGSKPVGATADLRKDGSSPSSGSSAEGLADAVTETTETLLLERIIGDAGTTISGRPELGPWDCPLLVL